MDKNLQSIRFPNLPDRYVIPTEDDIVLVYKALVSMGYDINNVPEKYRARVRA